MIYPIRTKNIFLMNCASWQCFIKIEGHRDGDIQSGDTNLESRYFSWTQTAAWMAFSTEGVWAIDGEPGSDKNKMAEPVLSSEVLPR